MSHITYQTFPIPPQIQAAITAALNRGKREARRERLERRKRSLLRRMKKAVLRVRQLVFGKAR
jgi:hypothetical protein